MGKLETNTQTVYSADACKKTPEETKQETIDKAKIACRQAIEELKFLLKGTAPDNEIDKILEEIAKDGEYIPSEDTDTIQK